MNNAGGVRVTTVFYYGLADHKRAISQLTIEVSVESRPVLITVKAKGASTVRPYALIEATIKLAILSWFVPIPRKMGRCVSMRYGAMRYDAMRCDAMRRIRWL